MRSVAERTCLFLAYFIANTVIEVKVKRRRGMGWAEAPAKSALDLNEARSGVWCANVNPSKVLR
jgi:hypothetical protein